MFHEYLDAALSQATYELIDDPCPYYGEISSLKGVWATGKTLEECREKLISVLEEWIILRIRLGRNIPPVLGNSIVIPAETPAIV